MHRIAIPKQGELLGFGLEKEMACNGRSVAAEWRQRRKTTTFVFLSHIFLFLFDSPFLTPVLIFRDTTDGVVVLSY